MEPGTSAGEQSRRRRSRADSMRVQAQILTERANRMERDADNWGRGYAGEQTVGAQLEVLRSHGYEVLHDVRWPGRQRANIDHVAIGPAGVLVVDAKNWSGNVTIRDGILRQNGYRRDREVDGASQAGRDVGDLLQIPWALHVIPVIALADSNAGGVTRAQDVTVLGHRDLVGWATGLPARLAPGDVSRIASHLRAAMPPASVPSSRRGRVSSSPRPPREPSARQRHRAAKRAAASRETLIKLVACLLLILLAPALLKWWGSHGDDVVRSAIPTPTLSATAPTPVVATPAFANCAALRVVYPFGVKLAGAKNTGKKPHGVLVVNDTAYEANAGLDRDQDGIACEVTRKDSRPRG